ncbi:MAG: DUF2971 domain-containing protein [Hyphomonas sp.]|jgi:hypothetical protein
MPTEVWRIFRYRNISLPHVIAEIWNSELYCGTPEKLNDPFDCQVDWRSSFSRVLKSPDLDAARKATILDIARQFIDRKPPNNVGICSFSVNANNHLMWSHYAQNHEGACLLYEIPADYLPAKYPAEKDPFFFVGGSPVSYDDNGYSDWLRSGNLFSPVDDPAENAVAKMFTSKSRAWSHEEEWRIVMSQEGLIKLEPHHLTQITYGLRTPERTRKLIAEIALTKNPKTVIGSVTRSAKLDFGLNFPAQNM